MLFCFGDTPRFRKQDTAPHSGFESPFGRNLEFDRAVKRRDRLTIALARIERRPRLVATAVLLRPGGEPMPEHAFVLEPSGTVRPFAALDSVVAAAGRIVGNP